MLSTIHSAKGLEWEAVIVINATEGGDPLDPCHGVGRPARRGATPLLRRPDASPDLADGDLPPIPLQLPGQLGRGLDQPTLTRFLPASIRRRFQETTA